MIEIVFPPDDLASLEELEMLKECCEDKPCAG